MDRQLRQHQDTLRGHKQLATHDPISFIVMISDSIADPNGEYHFVVNRSLNNASLVCWLNTESKRCTLSNIKARNQYDKNRFLCFFCSNLFEKLIENEGFTALHCACIEKNDRVIALIGERMSGKTTAELMLLNKGYNLISNDCALFKYNSEGQHIDVVAVIEDIFIREKSRFFDSTLKSCRDLSIVVHEAEDEGKQNRRMLLSHSDLARINKVKWVGKGTLYAIVFPKFNPLVNAIETHRSWVNSRQIIEKHRVEIGHDSTDFLSSYLGSFSSAEPLMDLISDIPSFYCEYSERTEDEFCSFISTFIGG